MIRPYPILTSSPDVCIAHGRMSTSYLLVARKLHGKRDGKLGVTDSNIINFKAHSTNCQKICSHLLQHVIKGEFGGDVDPVVYSVNI